MLGERNLLQLKIPGKNVVTWKHSNKSMNISFRQSPMPTCLGNRPCLSLFNHLIDDLEKSPIMAYKVQKSIEAPFGSHRRTTAWLWEKVDLAIELEQQKKNRADFDDRQLQLKPQDGYSGTAEVPGTPAPTGAAKTKKEKAAEKAEKDRKEKEKKAKRKEEERRESCESCCIGCCCCWSPKRCTKETS